MNKNNSIKNSKLGALLLVVGLFSVGCGNNSPPENSSVNNYVDTPNNTVIVDKDNGPFKTITAALNSSSITAGTTILVKKGIYNEAVNINKSGNASAYITLKGESGTVIDGAGLKTDYLIQINNKSYLKVIGFEIQNLKKNSGTPMGINVSGSSSFLEIRNNKVHGIEYPKGNAHGIAFYGDSGTPMTNIILDGNEVYGCKLGQSESVVLNGNVTDFVVSNNVIHDNDNIGIDFIGFEKTAPSSDQARNGVCFGNKVYNISTKDNPTYPNDRCADGIYVDGGKNIIIERNIVDNCDIGIECASEHAGKSTEKITIRNNFVSRSFQGNILMGGYAAGKGNAVDITVVNNTTYKGKDCEIAVQFNSSNVIIKNNILVANQGKTYVEQWGKNNTNIAVQNNLYFGASTNSPGDWSDTKSKFANPLLVNPYNDLHISNNSPAINVGLNLGAIMGNKDIDNQNRTNGTVDIGADEK